MSNTDSLAYKLNDPISKLPLIGPQYKKKLNRLDIYTIKDLIYHFPFRYQDTRQLISLEELIKSGKGTVKAQVINISNFKTRKGTVITTAQIQDNTGKLYATWFNQPYLTKTIKPGLKYIFHGSVKDAWGKTSLQNPQYEKIFPKSETTHLAKLTPIYPETAGVSSKWLRARIKTLKNIIAKLVQDNLPEKIIKKYNLMTLNKAIKQLHFPSSKKLIKKARYRLGINELVKIQIQAIKLIKKRKNSKTYLLNVSYKHKLIQKLIKSLPYKLTKAQQSAIKEILNDLDNKIAMNRLLNGDVGSGKTIVAVCSAISCYANNYSTVIMAPTTILAQQHYKNIKNLLKNAKISISVSLITSQEKIYNNADKPQIIIGTHALLFQNNLTDKDSLSLIDLDSYNKNPIALIIIDEQHRFGVSQRKTLRKLLKDHGRDPHYLTLTATPIPRTLTLALYGDIDVSILDELPKGRLPVKTHLVPEKKRNSAYKWIKEKIINGNQAFVICPLIEDSDKSDLASAQDIFIKLKEQIFPNLNIDILHGKLTDTKKNKIIKKLINKKTDILVSTTVIEVGIDIPDANIMIIENAERFGLAQLHQLRGRIGRNQKQAYCFLFSDLKNNQSKKRLNYFTKHNNGFKLAKFDLKQRGPGQVYGLKQSGLLDFQFADITDVKQIQKAKSIAKEI